MASIVFVAPKLLIGFPKSARTCCDFGVSERRQTVVDFVTVRAPSFNAIQQRLNCG
jgi:hypothetical protein